MGYTLQKARNLLHLVEDRFQGSAIAVDIRMPKNVGATVTAKLKEEECNIPRSGKQLDDVHRIRGILPQINMRRASRFDQILQ
jgi:hypothetical protein